jgi:alkanesulfonate monooxygenase SsuD/methylene tetrahydromethanopterin reductase-like flavin-dependent oxidoreductase (luciferase family)
LGDGWLASAYNTTPEVFADAWERLRERLRVEGKDPDKFSNAIATMFFYVTEDHAAAERIIRDVLSPALSRQGGELRQRLLVGPPEECAEKLAAYQAAGTQRIFLWPVDDELGQLTIFWERVAPLTQT